MKKIATSSQSTSVRPFTFAHQVFRLAFRNLARNKWRSFILFSSLVFFVGLSVFMEGFVSGFYRSLTESAVGLVLGDLQVHDEGHLPSRDLRRRIRRSDDVKRRILLVSDVRHVSVRVRTQGLLFKKEASMEDDKLLVNQRVRTQVVHWMGSDDEADFGVLAQKKMKGLFPAPGKHEVILGESLAKKLRVHIGDQLSLRAQRADGSASLSSWTLVGLLRTQNKEIDQAFVLAPFAPSAHAFGLDAPDATELAIRVRTSADLQDVKARVQARLNDGETSKYVVETWAQRVPSLKAAMETDHNFLRATFFVLLLVAAMMMLNLQMMSILERMGELGMMLAIGTGPYLLVGMLLVEAALLAVGGVFGGIALGALGVFSLSSGVDLSGVAEANTPVAGFQIAPLIYPYLSLETILLVGFGSVVVVTFAALLPSLRLFRTDPITAMRDAARN